MKKNIRGLSAVLLAVTLLAANTLTVVAADQSGSTQMNLPGGRNAAIQYTGGADTFFRFTNVIPGDTLTQNIEIQNSRNETVTFYLNATDSSGESALLQQIGLTVTNVSSNQVIYKGNLTGKPTSAYSNDMYKNSGPQRSGINLGSFSKNTAVSIKAEITVPLTLDNDYADKVSQVTWNIRAQIPDPPSSSSYPGRGTNRPDTDLDRSYWIITDEDIPLGGALYTIPDQQIPLAPLPKTGGSGKLGLVAAAVLLAASAQAFVKKLAKRFA